MSEITRRQLLGGVAMIGFCGGALASTAVARSTPRAGTVGSPPIPSSVDALRLKLLAHRKRISSLHAILEMEYVQDGGTGDDEGLWTLEGRTEMYYSSGRYRLVHLRDVGTITEVFAGNRYLQLLEPAEPGAEPEILAEGPADPRRRPKITLDSILPAPVDKPVTYLGMDPVAGVPCHVLLQSEYRLFLQADTGQVSRVDVFYTAAHVGMTVFLTGYEEYAEGIELPTEIRVKEMREDGSVAREHLTRLREVQVNVDLDPELFRIGRP